MSGRFLQQNALLASILGLTGCNCQDQSYVPLTWTDLDHDCGKWLSMDVAPDGSPVIAYYDVTMGALGFAIGEIKGEGDVRWKHEEVDGYPDSTGLDVGDVGQYASMKVAPDGSVWIAYYSAGSLRVAHRADGAWTSEVADLGCTAPSPDCGQWASLALDADSSPVVAHHDINGGTLRIARRTDGAWTAEVVAQGEDWNGTDSEGNSVTRSADVGQYARLVIYDGVEYVAYFDAAQQTLCLAEGTSGAYSDSVVYSVDGGNVGHWPSVWTDGEMSAIAFEDRANGDLVFARRESASGAFSIETVDAGDYVGADTEIFRRGSDFAILYFDGYNNDMKLASRAEGNWTTETLGGDGVAVGFFNEVIETAGTNYVASYDYTNRRLFFRSLP